ncbi:MAG: outer membrane protein assembly factor BamD [Gammaproteobacteria bacterium]|nr:outer membrane protein assembly factor BamD [Gammaproteobacteria bacterium]
MNIHSRLTLVLIAVILTLSACGGRNSVRDDVKDNQYTAEDVYDLAKESMERNNFNRAIQLFEVLEVRFPFSEFTRQGQLDLMYAYYRSRSPESAIEAANRFIREHPRHEKVDYAYYMRGLATFPDGLSSLESLFRVNPYARPQAKARESFDAFGALLQRFPESEWAEDARQRMVYLRNALARYELNVANYYMERGAYVAAANRAKRVLEEFQESDAVLDALQVQIDAYDKLGLGELAMDSKRVLEENRQRNP